MSNEMKTETQRNIRSNGSILLITIIAVANFSFTSFWNQENRIIAWDVISYYAYLPASFIHNDIYLEFLDDPTTDYSSQFWPQTTETGQRVIKTTMGVAYFYLPGFITGHIAASLSEYDANGFTVPYRFCLQLNGIMFLILGLIMVKRVLQTWFNDLVIAITLIAITAGTNLYYYGVLESTYSHIYSFFLFALFLLLTIKYYNCFDNGSETMAKREREKGIVEEADATGRIGDTGETEKPAGAEADSTETVASRRKAGRLIAAAGFTAGLITLIRPVNILILIIFILWKTDNLQDIRKRFMWFISNPSRTGIMILFFLLPWIPQLLYWKEVTGEWFYYSYQEEGFFFLKPHILKGLFSFRKGLFIYTPLTLLMFSGIILLKRRLSDPAIALWIFTPLFVYTVFSWWCWWYGGSFGQRPFVESYAIYAIPLAALIAWALKQKRQIKTIVLSLLLILSLHGVFQTVQYYYGAIHWDSMTREAWANSFGRIKPSEEFWQLISEPDYEGAQQNGEETND